MEKFSNPKVNKRMRAIRSKNSKIELLFRKALWSAGFRYYLHYHIIGKPDIVFPKVKIAIFVDSHFWHGYDWKNLRRKLKNDWVKKISNNIRRDKIVNQKLKNEGWIVLRFWEHEIKNNLTGIIKRIEIQINRTRKS